MRSPYSCVCCRLQRAAISANFCMPKHSEAHGSWLNDDAIVASFALPQRPPPEHKRQRSVQQTTMPTAIDNLIDEIMASDDDLDDEDDGESVASV